MRFVDTSFWFGLQDRLDRRHAQAAALATGQSRERLLSTNHVVGETWTLIRRRLGHTAALGRDERGYSFVDATSFAIMRRRRIREALAFDGAFAAAGFVELRP